MATGQQRRRQFAFNSAAGVLLMGVILALINILSGWIHLRWDMTRQHAYSLSPASKKLVRSLDDPLIIRAFFSKDLPNPYNTYARYVKDILAEYKAASGGRVRYEFVPPQPEAEFETLTKEAGMVPLQFEEMGTDQVQIRRGYMGLELFYRDHTEGIPVVNKVDHLEYELTSRIAQMTRRDKKRIGIVIGHGESNWRGSALKLSQDLPAFYNLDHPVDLPLGVDEPVRSDALLVVGPDQTYDDKSLWIIDQTIMAGVPVAFLVDTRRFTASQFMSYPSPTGLEALLKTYGVTLTDRLVYDAQCETVSMTQRVGVLGLTTNLRYPYVPLVTHLKKDHPILQGIEAVGLPFPTSMEPVSPPPAGVTFTPLLFSSDKSWLAPKDVYNLAPTALPQPEPGEPHGPYILGGLLEGTFPSHFAGKTPPVKGAAVLAKSVKTSIFVLSTSHLMDPNLPEFEGGAALITNAIGYLAHDETLIGIQSKGDILRPLKTLPAGGRDLVKFICILLIPLLPVAWGLVRWRRRSAWRRAVAAEFGTHS